MMSSSRVVRLRTMRCFVIERKWHVACHGRFVFDSARRAGRGDSFRFLVCFVVVSSDQRAGRATHARAHTLRIASHTHRPTDRPIDRPADLVRQIVVRRDVLARAAARAERVREADDDAVRERDGVTVT